MKPESCALAFTCLCMTGAAVWGPACTGTQNIHDTEAVRGEACYSCHTAAYMQVQTPKHVGVYPTTCEVCHSTTAWFPAAGGHPEAKFPILTGAHHNAAIGCTDCHIPSLGSDVLGQNTDCVHCHIGAHQTPAIDGAHTTVKNYVPSSASMPHNCLTAGCHPMGL
jgi:hypothetical protein